MLAVMNRREVPVSVRRLVATMDTAGVNVTEFCAAHGISRWFFYDVRRRYAVEGESVLEPASRAPRTSPHRVPAEMEDLVVEERKRLEQAGLDAGAATIRDNLVDRLEDDKVPSEATVWRILTRRGFIVPEPKKAPKHSYRTFSAERANQCWQIDATDWSLADGTAVKIVNIVDDCTRVLIASRAVASSNTEAAFETFLGGVSVWGMPNRVLSDNGKEFALGLAGLIRRLGVGHGHSRPYHPQTCGKVERFHQTLKKWLTKQAPAATLADLQAQLDTFANIYNHHRRHRSLDRQTPAHVFATTPKDGPSGQALDQPTTIHHVTVNPNGTIDAGRRYVISLGAAWAGQTVTAIITATTCHVFAHTQLIRQITLDPTRRVQPLYDRPGHPGNTPTLTSQTVRYVPRQL